MFAVTTTGWNVFDFQVGYSTCHWYVCQNPSFLKASMISPSFQTNMVLMDSPILEKFGTCFFTVE
jgi:hypothetical protein